MPPLPPSAGAPVSAVLITLNAAGHLEACLSSLSFVDEIVIVDSGSSDATLEIAERHGARVICQEWLGFGPQKQFAVAQARHNWVFCIDADERVTPELAAAITAALVAPRFQVYRVPRCNRFLGRFLRHGEGYPDWNLRLFHRGHARWSDDRVHEHVQTSGAVGALAGDLLHDSAETLDSYLAKQNRYTTLAAEAAVDAGKKATAGRLLLSPLFRFFKFYVLRRGFLDGVPGLVHTLIGCMNSFTKYAKMLDLQQRRSPYP
ncbi:MAG: glycosyltransferase family 2 protein [Betaproteobacteria bacterium]|nr:glycosyltransferase family 2 protein [Betaproteobacteria bacterium]